jgi:hypothetical protein
MASKQVVDRGRSASQVSAQIETHADEIQNQLKTLLEPHLARGEKMPDLALFVRLSGRLLTGRPEPLAAADRAHEAELSDDAAPRAERDDAERELRDTVVTFRNSISSNFGDGALRTLGIWDPPPSDTRGLATYAKDFALALADDTRAIQGKKRKGVTIDRHAMAKELTPEAGRLETALGVVTKEEAEATATQTAKNNAMTANDTAFAGVATAAEGLLTLAGRSDLAERVRPSARRPGVTQASEGAAEPPTPKTS